MLVLSREPGQRIRLKVSGVEIWIELNEIRGRNQARIGIDAPLEVEILREEMVVTLEAAKNEN